LKPHFRAAWHGSLVDPTTAQCDNHCAGSPLSSVLSLVRDPMPTPKTDEDKDFDVFISHALEDKEGGGMAIFN